MLNDGNPHRQKERIERAVESAYDFNALAIFDPDGPAHWLRFTIDATNGQMLSNGAVEYHVSEIADKTDDELRQLMKHLAQSFSKPLNSRMAS